jgi:hypothetical protein
MESSDAARAAPAIAGSDPRKSSCLAADGSEFNPNPDLSQGKNRPSAAVAAAIQRQKLRLLAIKRSSLSSLASMAGASLDSLMEALENRDDEATLEHCKRFLENARGFARLLADFRNEWEASQ